jgi:hypothetical protein
MRRRGTELYARRYRHRQGTHLECFAADPRWFWWTHRRFRWTVCPVAAVPTHPATALHRSTIIRRYRVIVAGEQ